MPVQIGVIANHFSNPTGLLSDCHRRIELFLGTLERVARKLEEPLAVESRLALDSALHYFREAAPKHTADEEESLFPRLRSLNDPELQPVLDSLAALEKDHQWAAALHDRVDLLGRKCLLDGMLPASEAKDFRESVENLTKMYAEHIRVEDTLVFPAAARRLHLSEHAAIGNEMAARRRIELGTRIPLRPTRF